MSDNTWASYNGPIKGIRIEEKADDSAKCPTATKDISVNLQNRKKAIAVADYGPLNPGEDNKEFWSKLANEWEVSDEEAKKQKCGNCSVFIVTPQMKSCIQGGLVGEEKKDEWEAIDEAGELGYCEAFDFKCASKRTCRAWVVGGPITSVKKD